VTCASTELPESIRLHEPPEKTRSAGIVRHDHALGRLTCTIASSSLVAGSTSGSLQLQVEEPMEVALGTSDALTAQADLLAVGVFTDLEPGPGAEPALEALGTPLPPLLESRGFSGKTGESVALPTLGRLPAATLLLIGLGDRAAVDDEVLRRATGSIVREARGARPVSYNTSPSPRD
jgi:hypothetical protein